MMKSNKNLAVVAFSFFVMLSAISYVQIAPECAPNENNVVVRLSDSPYINIEYPIGGSNIRRDTNIGITWVSPGCSDANVWINLTILNVCTFRLTDSTPNDGYYSSWCVPWDLEEANAYFVVVGGTVHPEQCGFSGNFYIFSKQTTEITSIEKDDVLVINETYPIDFTYSNYFRYVDIDLYKGGVYNRNLATNKYTQALGSGSMSWQVPDDVTLGKDYSIKVTEHSNGTDYGFSQSFEISNEAPEEDNDDKKDDSDDNLIEIDPDVATIAGIIVGSGAGITAVALIIRKKKRIVPQNL